MRVSNHASSSLPARGYDPLHVQHSDLDDDTLQSLEDASGIGYSDWRDNEDSLPWEVQSPFIPGLHGDSPHNTRSPHGPGRSSRSRCQRTRFPPDIVDPPPEQSRTPPGRGALPLRSALRQKKKHPHGVTGGSPDSFTRNTSQDPKSRWTLHSSIRRKQDSSSRHMRASQAFIPPSPSQSSSVLQSPPCFPGENNVRRSRHSWQRPPPVPIESPIIPGFHNYPSVPTNSLGLNYPREKPRRCGPLQNVQPMASQPFFLGAQSGRYAPYVLRPANSVATEDTVDSIVKRLADAPADRFVWQTSQGELAWVPHPTPAPAVSPQSFWGPSILESSANRGHQVSSINAHDVANLTGGNPLPGTAPYWMPGNWPPHSPLRDSQDRLRVLIQVAPWIIPNPCNAYLPHLMWDISQSPTTAKRITGNHVIMDVNSILTEVATYPAVEILVVACNVGVAQQLWGLIGVKQSRPGGVRIWDVMLAIYDYFQMRVGRRELKRISQALGDGEVYEKMVDAMSQRCAVTPALPGYEIRNGLKRIDCLGDATFFWGSYVSYNSNGTWQLNLGLVNRRRMA